MKVLFAWEVGRNFGHVTQIAGIAAALAKKRAKIFMALQNPEGAAQFAQGFNYKLLQAPYKPVNPKRGHVPLNFAGDLIPCGYDKPETIAALVKCWRDMFDLAAPDVLVAQAAPTALLAARGRKIKTVQIGRGYDVPPLDTPMPAFSYWEPPPEDKLRAQETFVLDNINEALKSLKLKPLRNFSELLKTDTTYLSTLEELDHYKERPDARYYFPFFTNDSGETLSWRKSGNARILCYIRPGTAVFKAVVQALVNLPENYDIILAAPGLNMKDIEALNARPHIRAIGKAVRLDRLLKRCDLGIHHGGGGFSSALLLSGVPALILPGHIEQLMSARAAGRTGAARGLAGKFGPEKVLNTIEHMLADPSFKEKAKAIAKKYKDTDPQAEAGKIATEIVKLSR